MSWSNDMIIVWIYHVRYRLWHISQSRDSLIAIIHVHFFRTILKYLQHNKNVFALEQSRSYKSRYGQKSLRQKGYGDPHFFLAKRWIYENRKMEIVKIIRKKGLERWKKRRSNESICLRIMTSYPLLCLRFGSPSERKCQISKSDRWKFRFFSVFIRTFAQREFVWPNSDRSKSHRTNDSIGDVRIPQYWSLDFNLVWDSVYDAPDKLICGF